MSALQRAGKQAPTYNLRIVIQSTTGLFLFMVIAVFRFCSDLNSLPNDGNHYGSENQRSAGKTEDHSADANSHAFVILNPAPKRPDKDDAPKSARRINYIHAHCIFPESYRPGDDNRLKPG